MIADVAILTVGAMGLANTGAVLIAARMFARQLRITAPPKEPAQDATAQAAPVSIGQREAA